MFFTDLRILFFEDLSKIINESFALNFSKILFISLVFKISFLKSEKIIRSTQNIPNVKVTDVNHFSSYDVVKFKKIIFTETSMRELEKKYA